MDNISKLNLEGIKENEILAPYTSFKIGGPAKFFYVAESSNDVIKAITQAVKLNLNFFILGNGSNILVSDKGFNGLVIKMENTKIEINDNVVYAESGAKVQKLIRETISNNLTGFEYLIGIPGTLGGGVAGNIGTPEKWIDENIIEVMIVDLEGNELTLPKSQCDFSYRYSRFKNNEKEIILGAKFKLLKSNQKLIQQKVKEFLDKRSHQPVNMPCAGSIFKNPEGYKSWKLIDEVQLRGKKIGGAKVSEEHANFIINTGKATAEDVVVLISLIKQQVRDKLGVQLNEEIKYIGFEN